MMEKKFISYAQNFEDVMLWRALGHIERGFYVDVGAHDPVVDSVTKVFSLHGWRGINIEPVSRWHERLVADRPDDINLQMVASSAPSQMEFFEITESGWSTAKREIADRYADDGHAVVHRRVEALPLSAIFERHGVTTVHFLKVDVEGSEEDVIKGIDFTRVRPWVVVVEAVDPHVRQPTHGQWEHYLLDAGYRMAYFDGVNRFYVDDAHSELLPAFEAPPNVFDNFVQYLPWMEEQRLRQALRDCQDDVRKVTNSLTWRLTKPLRAPANIFRSIKERFK
jgi:FkbM family methyltransferase